MSKHTLGSWHLAGDADGTMVTDDKGAQIAMWPPQGGTVEQCANARLIAAAPDLMMALVNLRDFVVMSHAGKVDYLDAGNQHPAEVAQAAILKATSDQS